MKVLLVSYFYPPDRAVGGQRARKVAEALKARGHDVQVLAAGAPAVDSAVRRVLPWPSARRAYAWLRDRLGHGTGDTGEPEGDESSESRTVGSAAPFWKRWIFSLIWLPDDKQGFIPPAVFAASRLSDRPDVIYTTAPPFSVHLAGLVLKALTGARWIAEFRDPWTANPWKPAYLRSAFSDWFERKLENLCLESADLLVAVSEGIELRLAESGTETPSITVRNGMEEVTEPAEGPSEVSTDRPFTIVHAGSFYHSRNPFPFLQAVERLLQEGSVDPSGLRVRLIGATEAYQGRSIRAYIEHAHIEAQVHVEGWMAPADALACVRGADALLLLAVDQPDQVPNKLYEYLGARRPILAVADETGETARMLRQVGDHTLVHSNDPVRIHRALHDLVTGGRTGPVGDPDVLEGWRTDVQMERLLTAIESQCSASGTRKSDSSPFRSTYSLP